MNITNEKKIELITEYIKAVYNRLQFEEEVGNVFGDTWMEQTETGGSFMDMYGYYENILFDLLDETYCNFDWLMDIVDVWAKIEIKGEKHLPYCYDADAGFPTYQINTVDELARCIVDMPLLIFDGELNGEQEMADENY